MAAQRTPLPPALRSTNHVSVRSLPLGRFRAKPPLGTLYVSRFTLHAPHSTLPAPRFSLPASHLLTSSSLRHLPFLLILLLHLALSLSYASQVPLGEAPDEPAHLAYARFIAHHGRLPVTLAERQEAGYRSAWPPLYHFLVAGPLAIIGDAPPTRLKAVGDTPRRLIPTNGQTIAAFIHTADEAPPWRGLPLAWHLGRFISVGLTALSVVLTYVIAWRLTGQRNLATSAAALHAFIPQLLFIGSTLNDDNLLICLSGLILLLLIGYPRQSSPRRAFFLGALLGLATIAKYNALPLWILVVIWGIGKAWQGRKTGRPGNNSFSSNLPTLQPSILPFFAGALLTGGWWFSFIWLNFNQVDRLGLLPGSLAALITGTSDASLRRLTAGNSLTFPSTTAWLEWFITLFETFWGSFGGGSTIDLPTWAYGLLGLMCLLAIISGVRGRGSGGRDHLSCSMLHAPPSTLHPPLLLFLLSPLLFLPLPLLRFILTGSIVETAQGRHLFPALPAITLGLVWSLSRFGFRGLGFGVRVLNSASRSSRFRAQPPLGTLQSAASPWDSSERSLPLGRFTPLMLPLFTLSLSLYSLSLISASYPPPIPLRTTANAATATNLLNVRMVEGIILVGYEVGQAGSGVVPLTLVWQADAVPSDDYLIELTLSNEANQPLGGWLGHPLGGRYPTRAWDKGDVLRHTILIPLLPDSLAISTTLTLRLLDSFNQPTTSPLTLTTNLSLSPAPLPPRSPTSLLPQLRADELPPDAPFTYRSTLSFVLSDSTPPELIAPTGQTFPPARFLSGSHSSIAHFIVAANWPSGDYYLLHHASERSLPLGRFTFHVSNRPRQFDLPPMEHTVNANFADTLTLLGFDLPERRVQPGDSFPLTLHWRAERSISQNLIVFNHLLDPAVIQYGGADRIPQLYYTTLLWAPSEIVSDSYDVPVDANAPPGVYWLDVGLYPSAQPTFSLPLFENGQPINRNSVHLGPLKIGGPPPNITVSDVHPQNPLNISFDNQITLLGFDLTDSSGNPLNSQFTIHHSQLILFWRADTSPTTDYTVFVHLLDRAGNLVAQFDSPPAAGAYPTSLWDPGEIIADERSLTDLTPGHYTLQVGLYRSDTGERLAVAGSLDGAVKLAEIEVQ